MGWKQIHFSLHLENISVATQRNKNGPLGDTKLFWALRFPPPDPVVLVVRPWVTQSLSRSYFLCNTNSTAVPKSDRWTKWMFSHLERQRICCLSLVDSDSLLVIWCTSIYLFIFADFPFWFQLIQQAVQPDVSQFLFCASPEELLWETAHNQLLSMHCHTWWVDRILSNMGLFPPISLWGQNENINGINLGNSI